MGDCDGQIAWITGGASGIGAATARSMASQGTRIGILDIDMDKAALQALTKAVANEVAKHGVTCNAVSPGTVDTPLARAFIKEPRYLEHLVKTKAFFNPFFQSLFSILFSIPREPCYSLRTWLG